MKKMIVWMAGLMALLMSCGAMAGDEPKWRLATRLTADHKARNVGDLLTVAIVEELSAKRDAKQATDKSFDMGGSASVFHPRIDTRPEAWTNATVPAYSATANRKFSGSGSMENKDAVTGHITVRVTDVLPNGNLIVEGRRTMAVQGDSVTMILTGTVRVEDISADNVVQSTAVADAMIRYESTGTIADTQKKGMLTRLVDWINPF